MTESQRARVQSQFGASAEAYVTSAGHAEGPDLDRLLAWGRELRPRRVLDVATGGGHTALAFAALAPQVVAMDLTVPMLQAAARFVRSRGATNVSFTAGDVAALPFREAAFDVVTCRIAAHHFPDVPGAVRQIAPVLARGGALLLQDILGHDDPEAAAFVTEVERRRDPSHVRAFRQVEWTAFLRAVGLTVIDDAILARPRPWAQWTERARMTPEARASLERFVLDAPERLRATFDFRVSGSTIESFTDRMLLLRAEKG